LQEKENPVQQSIATLVSKYRCYEKICRVEYLLNTRPRKRFGGKTPLEVLLEKTGVAIDC